MSSCLWIVYGQYDTMSPFLTGMPPGNTSSKRTPVAIVVQCMSMTTSMTTSMSESTFKGSESLERNRWIETEGLLQHLLHVRKILESLPRDVSAIGS